jgi:hypothetical protein
VRRYEVRFKVFFALVSHSSRVRIMTLYGPRALAGIARPCTWLEEVGICYWVVSEKRHTNVRQEQGEAKKNQSQGSRASKKRNDHERNVRVRRFNKGK